MRVFMMIEDATRDPDPGRVRLMDGGVEHPKKCCLHIST
jgi:hypothetical protein